MTVSINQPAYLPWLGYFERIARSDLHIVLDHVQFEKNSFTNRNKIPTQSGTTWLTIPLVTKGQFGDLSINHLRIQESQRWGRKHWANLRQTYLKAAYFKTHADFFEDCYQRSWEHLLPLTDHITGYLLKQFGIPTPLISSSDLNPSSAKSDLVFELCQSQNATTYLSGAMGKDYLDLTPFQQNNIEVEFQDYKHPVYTQFPKSEFTPYLGALDLLFHHGPDSLDILLNSTPQ